MILELFFNGSFIFSPNFLSGRRRRRLPKNLNDITSKIFTPRFTFSVSFSVNLFLGEYKTIPSKLAIEKRNSLVDSCGTDLRPAVNWPAPESAAEAFIEGFSFSEILGKKILRRCLCSSLSGTD